jgi:hypothetical protein
MTFGGVSTVDLRQTFLGTWRVMASGSEPVGGDLMGLELDAEGVDYGRF